jgi:hypothetical protein
VAFAQGTRAVGTAPALLWQPVINGAISVQSWGTANLVYVGGPTVASVGASAGVALPLAPSGSVPGGAVPFPVIHYGQLADADDGLYAVCAGGTVNVAFVAPA